MIERSEHCHCGCSTFIIRCEECKAEYEISDYHCPEPKFCPNCGSQLNENSSSNIPN